ncbi:transcription initiation factor IIB [Boothiomyces macroporosus]|uniref:Transcription initiation factor IIB n=1 Tax=Boothiomyces macroporosus TaxID=261099 RepID=A0AAD5Y070_9FUNG|nr:transcription initiation factor IIB [Boothiomyces macroporosus]
MPTAVMTNQDLNLYLICSDCRDEIPNIVEDFARGDLICGSCGLILGSRLIDTRPEWRTFSSDDKNSVNPNRVGNSNHLMGSDYLDSTAVIDDGKTISKILSRTQQMVSKGKNYHNLMESFQIIQQMADKINLPKAVSDSAKQLFKKVYFYLKLKVDDEKLLRGKPTNAVIATCLFIACRMHHAERSFKEISYLTLTPKRLIGSCFNIIKPILKTHPVEQDSIFLLTHIRRFGSLLSLDKQVIKTAEETCQLVTGKGLLTGKSPITIVGACIYYATSMSNDPKSAHEISGAVHCAENTLRNAYRIICLNKEDS